MKHTRITILTVSILSELLLLTATLFCAAYFDIDVPLFADNAARDFIVGIIGSIPPLVLFFFIVSKKAAGLSLFKGIREIALHDIRNIFSQSRLIDLILISLAAGVAEELLFRGVLQVQFGIVASSILFGLVHFISPFYMIIAAIMGFYLGAVFSLFDNLMIPALIHSLYDLGALVYLRFFVRTGDVNY